MMMSLSLTGVEYPGPITTVFPSLTMRPGLQSAMRGILGGISWERFLKVLV